MDFKQLDKPMLAKHAEKGQQVVTNLQTKAEQFKMRALAFQEMAVVRDNAFEQLRKYLGKNYVVYIKTNWKPKDEKKKAVLEGLELAFYKIAVKIQELEVDNRNCFHEIKGLRKERMKFQEKMFRFYHLNRQRTYRFDFDKKEILEAMPEKPPVIQSKPATPPAAKKN